jgi:hypothetical protein
MKLPWAITLSRRPPTLQMSTFHLQGSKVPIGCVPVRSLSPVGRGPKTPWSGTLQLLKCFSTSVFHVVHLDRARPLRPALQIIGIYRHYSMAGYIDTPGTYAIIMFGRSGESRILRKLELSIRMLNHAAICISRQSC